MSNEKLLTDGHTFSESRKISAKHPTEYWLSFIKKHIINYKTPKYYKHYFLLLIPIALVIVLNYLDAEIETIIILFIVSLVFCLIAGALMKISSKYAFVPVNAYHDLARFIISIKGDIYKKRFAMRINLGSIESNINSVELSKLGLTKQSGVSCKPYQIERYKANFTLKDGSVCSLVLNQIYMRIASSKRRSSGKTKTKIKHKHKFFHLLTLKLKAADYDVLNASADIMNTNRFDITLHTENGFHFIKVKAKVKMSHIPEKLKENTEHKPSLYTDMITYLLKHKIISKTKSNQLTK